MICLHGEGGCVARRVGLGLRWMRVALGEVVALAEAGLALRPHWAPNCSVQLRSVPSVTFTVFRAFLSGVARCVTNATRRGLMAIESMLP